MSQETTQPTSPPDQPAGEDVARSTHVMSLLTLASRILGVLRESLAARYFGAGLVSSAFTVAFTIPNLFRRLFGEGALVMAFMPLYSRARKEQSPEEARRFAAASVNFLAVVLVILTIVGELVIWGIARIWRIRPDHMLAVKLTAVMLPYVLLICGTAFLGSILQAHRRFAITAATPIVLNLGLIGGTILGARLWDMRTLSGQTSAIYLVSCLVLVAGVIQVAMLVPSLRAVGFQFQWTSLWTPAIRRLAQLSIPLALGAGVLQFSTLLDRGISFLLAQGVGAADNAITHFSFLGDMVRYPMENGAAARLAWAQYLYQFPLGVFAIALATAMFPALTENALDADRQRFRQVMLDGIKVSLWEGLPASVGLILVAQPAVQILFERGSFGPGDTAWVAASVRMYSIGIWAFGLQQILNRAYYALHDMTTPLLMAILTLIVNLAVEIPLIWTGLGEAGMAVGTSASFIVQALVMLWLLQKRVGSFSLGQIKGYVLKLLIATAFMAAACVLVQYTPLYPNAGDHSKRAALVRLLILMSVGGVAYLGACIALRIGVKQMLRGRPRSASQRLATNN